MIPKETPNFFLKPIQDEGADSTMGDNMKKHQEKGIIDQTNLPKEAIAQTTNTGQDAVL